MLRPAAATKRVRRFRKFFSDESGANSLEYALIAALIGIACLTALQALGVSVTGAYSNMSVRVDGVKNSN